LRITSPAGVGIAFVITHQGRAKPCGQSPIQHTSEASSRSLAVALQLKPMQPPSLVKSGEP
jgi:hypothetical protein